MGRPDVFVEITAVSLAAFSIRASTSFLTSIRSTTTSITHSASPILSKSSSKLPSVIRLWLAAEKNGSGLALVAALKAPSTSEFLAPSRPMLSGVTSSRSTASPAFARWAAIWLPITPAPITAAVRKGRYAHAGALAASADGSVVVKVGVSMLSSEFRVQGSEFASPGRSHSELRTPNSELHQTNAPRPVTSRPTMSELISLVPS